MTLEQTFDFATAINGSNADQRHNLVCGGDLFKLPRVPAIYRIVCCVTGREYIGSAILLRSRLRNHQKHLRKRTHCNSRLQREWDKYGEHSFFFGVLEFVQNKDTLIEREQFFFDTRKPELILCKVAGRNPTGRQMSAATKKLMRAIRKGKKASDETRARLSIARRARVISMDSRLKQSATLRAKMKNDGYYEFLVAKQRETHLGKPKSLSCRLKISASNKLRYLDPEVRRKASESALLRWRDPSYREKLSLAMKGKPLSQEHRASLSLAHKGKPWSNSRRAAHEARFGKRKVIAAADYTGDPSGPDEGEED